MRDLFQVMTLVSPSLPSNFPQWTGTCPLVPNCSICHCRCSRCRYPWLAHVLAGSVLANITATLCLPYLPKSAETDTRNVETSLFDGAITVAAEGCFRLRARGQLRLVDEPRFKDFVSVRLYRLLFRPATAVDFPGVGRGLGETATAIVLLSESLANRVMYWEDVVSPARQLKRPILARL